MNTYSTEDLKALSIEEITNLVNQIYDEKDLYKKKYEGLLAAKKKYEYISQRTAAQVANNAQDQDQQDRQWIEEWMHNHNAAKSISNRYKIRSYAGDDDEDDDPYGDNDPFELL